MNHLNKSLILNLIILKIKIISNVIRSFKNVLFEWSTLYIYILGFNALGHAWPDAWHRFIHFFRIHFLIHSPAHARFNSMRNYLDAARLGECDAYDDLWHRRWLGHLRCVARMLSSGLGLNAV